MWWKFGHVTSRNSAPTKPLYSAVWLGCNQSRVVAGWWGLGYGGLGTIPDPCNQEASLTIPRHDLKPSTPHLIGKEFWFKKSGNEVYYTAWCMCVIIKHSCSELHCQKVWDWNSLPIKSVVIPEWQRCISPRWLSRLDSSSSSSFLLASLESSDAKVYEPWVQALLGTASHLCEVFFSFITPNLSKSDQLLITHRSPSTDNRDSFYRHPETVLGCHRDCTYDAGP